MSNRIIQFPSLNSSAVAAKSVNRHRAQVVQMTAPIRQSYVPLLADVEANIVRDWKRGVGMRQIASMYRGRGVGVCQIEAILHIHLVGDFRRAA